MRKKWKASTAVTSENRITPPGGSLAKPGLSAITLKALQAFLGRKAGELSRSMVAHLRWDLRAVFKLAIAEGYAQRDPTAALYTQEKRRKRNQPAS